MILVPIITDSIKIKEKKSSLMTIMFCFKERQSDADNTYTDI